MYTPKLYKKTNNSIELRWTNLPRRNGVEGDRVYSLYWNRGGDREPLSQLVERIADNKYTVTGLEPNTIYKFKLRAVNDCGAGPFSRVETATTYSCPESPSVITTSRDGANLVLNWEDRYAKTNRFNKAKVTSYQVLFETKDKKTSETKLYCDGSNSTILKNRSCSVPLEKVPIQL